MLTKTIGLLLVAACCCAVPHKIIRPCNLKDHKCIRDNLSVNSECNTVVKGALPSKTVMQEFRYETPYFNSSYIDRNLIMRNRDKCFVSEFFFNYGQDTALLAIDCPFLDVESDRTLVQHYSLQEDSYYSYHIRGTYPLIRLTMNIRNAGAMNICDAFVFAEVTALPIFHLNPKDRPTANFLTKDLTELNIYEIETFAYRGGPLAREFINTVLCDFGCN